MEFQKKRGAIFGIGLLVAGLGGLGTVLLVGWFFSGGRLPLLLFLAPVALVIGMGVVVYGMLPFRLRIDANGITTRNPPEGLNTFVPWSQIAAVTVEHKPGDSAETAPYVVLWPAPGADLGAEPGFRRDGRPAYLLGQTDEITESEERIRAAIAEFGGSRPGPGPHQAPPPLHPPQGPPQPYPHQAPPPAPGPHPQQGPPPGYPPQPYPPQQYPQQPGPPQPYPPRQPYPPQGPPAPGPYPPQGPPPGHPPQGPPPGHPPQYGGRPPYGPPGF
ncbi:hypothetical protein [Nocardiopsis composta]|uniref:PH domain-containing protein n=1 Tax=Nocardiopsis composta TaxID=157465 RepID=A0A7W8QLJ4_9ACTN|nr:hypothetical protein [Nocardiopsis composta]MBB5432530.1 hypothetical protein [Nocardiopsis composta]